METKMHKLLIGLFMVVSMILFNSCFPGELPQPPEYTENRAPYLENISPKQLQFHTVSGDTTFSAEVFDLNSEDRLDAHWFIKTLDSEELTSKVDGDLGFANAPFKAEYTLRMSRLKELDCGLYQVVLIVSDRGFEDDYGNYPNPSKTDAANVKTVMTHWIIQNNLGSGCSK